MKTLTLFATLLLNLAIASTALAKDEAPRAALSGYDPVAYQSVGEAVRGSGFHVSTHRGHTYLFASAENKKAFDSAPGKYVPAYNGWCAYGVAVGKKFHADPTVFAVVEGKTYLNLDKDIQQKWSADRDGAIQKADKNWRRIRKKAAAEL